MTEDFALIFSLISLGFFGGFSHCVGMCGPFVMTQVSSNFQKIPLQNFSTFQKLKGLALVPYHLGRITTYSLIGFFSSLLTQNIQEFFNFKILAATFLFLASLFFFNLFFEKKILRFKSKFLESATSFFSRKTAFLFQNPQGFRGYFLGLILGFIPCGLLYGAFLIAAAIQNPLLAALGMFLFGMTTFPALFLTALGSNFMLKFSNVKFIAKLAILINAIMLFLMAIKLIN